MLGVSCFDYKSLGNKNEEGRKWSKQQERKEHEQTLSQVTRRLEWNWDLERLWSFDLCLGVNALALVLNGNFRKLGFLELWWLGGIYSPQPPTSRWGRLLSMGAPDSPVHRHVTQPLGFESSRPLEALSSSGTGQSGATPDRSCSLSGVPLTLCSDSVAHCSPL
jgi:hypothetical protein